MTVPAGESAEEVAEKMLLKGKRITLPKKYRFQFVLCMTVFVFSAVTVALNLSLLKRPVFQKKIDLVSPSIAKYEKDGNMYIVDNSGFRLLSITLEGKINYAITIEGKEEYTRIYDLAIDETGNLYVYAMEREIDAFLTKRDMIRKYDRNGKFVKNILTIDYNEYTEDRPHDFPQFGSMRCDKTLTFSRIRRDRVDLYSYDTYRDELTETAFFHKSPHDFAVGRLALKNFDNFVYTTRDGDIYEVKDSGDPLLRASFNFNEDTGGIIPWHPAYDSRGNIIFIDMISSFLYSLDASGAISEIIPKKFFDEIYSEGIPVKFVDYGFWVDRFSGVAGDYVWYYDGSRFKTFKDGILLPLQEQAAIIVVQIFFVLGIAALFFGVYLLFSRILEWYVSLIIKQILIIIPLTIAGFIILYTFVFNSMLNRLNNELINELSLLTESWANLMNGDEIDSLKSIKDCNGNSYRRIARFVKNAIGDNKSTWNKAFYAAIYKVIKNEEYFVTLSSDDVNLFRPAGLYVEQDSNEYALITEGKPFTSMGINYTGSWVYSNFPVYNSSGNISGIFETGLDLAAYNISNLKHRQTIAFFASIIVLIILVALALVVLVVIKQLSKVAEVLAAIASGEYSRRIKYSGKDELGVVSFGLNRMAENLQQQIEYIKKINESTIRFVPVQFMEYLGVTDITKMKLGDHVRRDLSVLFLDIRSFSIHSEILTTQENFFFINKLLSFAGPILRSHNGFVDKFIGDAIMALFADAKDAVRAGIEIYRGIVLSGTTRIEIGIDSINIGIGIHTGSVMMGIVGEPERLSSTVISKNVNLASRVESLTKQTKSGMLITRDTLNHLVGSEGEFQYRFIGMIQAAGVNEVIGLFDMLDALPEPVRERRLATKKIFESGVRKYHIKEYQVAANRFEMVAKMDPADACARICLAAAKEHMENPNLPGVFIYDKK